MAAGIDADAGHGLREADPAFAGLRGTKAEDAGFASGDSRLRAGGVAGLKVLRGGVVGDNIEAVILF